MIQKFLLIFLVLNLILIIKCDEKKNHQSNEVIHIPTENDNEFESHEETKKLLVKNIKFADVNTNNEDLFIPTNEWQVVKENQAIPKGLHVRLNMQTGQKEAKLLDEDQNGDKMRELNKDLFKEKSPMPSMKFDHEELKNALKNLKDTKSNVKFNVEDLQEGVGEEILSDNMNDEEKEAIKSKFRSYEELKKDFEGLNLTIKTDNELMKELMEKYNNTSDTSEKIAILKDFEYYVHQYDNGLLLCDIGAFNKIMNELNSTINSDTNVKINAALVLGAAMQGNPKVQIYAVENGLLHLILHLISKHDSKSTNNDLNIKIVFVLSTLLRHFPYAQLKFLENGGLQVLNEFMQQSPSHKLKVKIITLIDDLILEQIDVLNIDSNDPNNKLKLDQYKKIDLIERLTDTDWCNYLAKLLLETSEELDTIEKILKSISTLTVRSKKCLKKIKNIDNFIKSLNKLIKHYDNLSKNNNNDEDDNSFYFKDISNLIFDIKNTIRKNEGLIHDDL